MENIKMKTSLYKIILAILSVAMLTSCGGGGNGGGLAATPIEAIQAQLAVWQNKFSTTHPAAADVELTNLFDDTWLQDGDDKSAFLTKLTASSGVVGFGHIPTGIKFTPPVVAEPLDPTAMANDATHQWFSTSFDSNGRVYKTMMLAVKNIAGQWLLAGNQRKVGVSVTSSAFQHIYPTASGLPDDFVSNVYLNLFLNSNSSSDSMLLAQGVTTVSVSGPGLIGSTTGVAGIVTIFTSTPSAGWAAGTQWIQCQAGFVETNCLDVALVNAGIYTFDIVGITLNGATFSYTYKEAFTAVPPAKPTATMFPVVNSITPSNLAGLVDGVNVSVNWTLPVDQVPLNGGAFLVGYDSNGSGMSASLISNNGAGATLTSSGTLFVALGLGVVTKLQLFLTSVSTKGVAFQVTKDY
jgi:hypothetical protein